MAAMTISPGLRRTLTGFTLVVLVVIYVPLALVLLNSFNTDNTFGWPPPGYTLDWWQLAWHSQGVRDALWTSIKVATISSHSAARPSMWLRPVAMNSASDITIGSIKPLRPSMSNTTIVCKLGQRARHDSTLSSCSSSSAKITRVRESLTRYSTWAAESV